MLICYSSAKHGIASSARHAWSDLFSNRFSNGQTKDVEKVQISTKFQTLRPVKEQRCGKLWHCPTREKQKRFYINNPSISFILLFVLSHDGVCWWDYSHKPLITLTFFTFFQDSIQIYNTFYTYTNFRSFFFKTNKHNNNNCKQ